MLVIRNTTASNSVLIGNSAGRNINADRNFMFGTFAGENTTTGYGNTMFGYIAGRNNTTGFNNLFLGNAAGLWNRTGGGNIFIGNSTGSQIGADSLSGGNNILIGNNAGDNIRAAAAGNVAIGYAVDLPTNNGSNQLVIKNVYFATGASGTGTTIAAASKAGIKTNAPNRDLEVAGEVRITDLTTDPPTRLVGADADGDLGQVTLGAGLGLASSSLLADTSFLVTRFDTASMLTNYLRTGTAASTYLTQSNAALTYLPLTGGTLSGSLDINTNNGSNSFQDSTLKVTYNQSSLGVNQDVTGIYSSVNTTGYTSTGILSEASTIYTTAIGVKGKATQSDINGPGVAIGIVGEIAASGSGSNGSTYAGYFNNTSTVGGNHYGLFVNTASGGDYGIYQTGNGINYLGSNTSIGGTLGVTGETTLSALLTVNSSAVFNEGSTDSDFRVESDGNANMVFVDASMDRVGIGYASPTKTLDVNGEVRINTVTATPTSLLGKDGSNVVGNVTLGNSLTLSSGTLSVNNKITDINTSQYTILANDLYIDNFNNSSTTIILPLAELNTFRELKFKNSSTGSLIANDNIIPLNGSGTTTTILPATNAKWCTLVSDGGFWRIMQSN
jgi:hypothetical protein